MNAVDEATWIYLAGFIDGEGCFSTTRRRTGGRIYPRLSISQKYGNVLDDLMAVFGVGRKNLRGGGDRAPSWHIDKREDFIWVTEGVLPHLRLKEPQAVLGLQLWQDLPMSVQEGIARELKALKRILPSDMPRDAIYMNTAEGFAARSTCQRASVGAVLVKDRRIISVGYNGSPQGQPHCLDVGCELDTSGSCMRSVHAETNAIVWTNGRTATEGAEMYVTLSPCVACAKSIIAAGIKRVVYGELYRLTEGLEVLEMAKVELVDFNDD